jgi:HSP20 family protein
MNEFSRLQREMNRMFGAVPNRNRAEGFPAVNVWQEEDAYLIEAEVPGSKNEDISISVQEGNQLTIEFERVAPDSKTTSWKKRERVYGKFSRKLELPSDVDGKRIEAKLLNGILTVRAPKREEAIPRKIEVKSVRS